METPVDEKRDDLESMTSTKFVEDRHCSGAGYVGDCVYGKSGGNVELLIVPRSIEHVVEQELESQLRWKMDWHIVPLSSVVFCQLEVPK